METDTAAMTLHDNSFPVISPEAVAQRFLRYVAIDTKADRFSETSPSTPGQRILGDLLVAELLAMGLHDAAIDGFGYVTATLGGNAAAPPIGLVAHLDTSPDAPGGGIQPVVHRDYRGGPIAFAGNPDLVLSPETCPALATTIGQDIITTDGTTLLGGDDKAGIAAIMAAVEAMVATSAWPHGDIRVVFTPDEEIGRGTDHLDIEALGLRFAYTVDGEAAPELNDENFNAATAKLTITGLNVHPGKAKGVMVNAVQILGEFLALLPPGVTPQDTSGREGFFHPHFVEGSVDRARVEILLRDFEAEGLEEKARIVSRAVETLGERFPGARFDLRITPAYRNMRPYLDAEPHVVDLVEKAVEEAGLKPRRVFIRGGTDGAGLSRAGVLTPNLFTGSGNHHGLAEWASIQQMAKAAEVVVRLARLWTTV